MVWIVTPTVRFLDLSKMLGDIYSMNDSRGKKTCIDVTLYRNTHINIRNWHVDRTFNGSYHNNITFETSDNKLEIPKIWQWHKANWELFRPELKGLKYELPS